MHLPELNQFRALAREYPRVPVYRRLLSDGLTPVTAFHQLDDGQHACLFESVIGGEKVGRYSFLTTGPFLEMSARGCEVTVTAGSERTTWTSTDPLEELRQRLHAIRAAELPELPPFTAGAIGYAGYDVVRYVEDLPNAPRDDRGLPDLSFAFYDRMLVFDNVNKTMYVIVMANLETANGNADVAYERAQREIDELVARLSRPNSLPPVDIATTGNPQLDWLSNFTQADFEAAVRRSSSTSARATFSRSCSASGCRSR